MKGQTVLVHQQRHPDVVCPRCGARKMHRNGMKWQMPNGQRVKVQQWYCRTCGARTINPRTAEGSVG